MTEKKNGVGQHLAWTDYADLLAKIMGQPMTAKRAAQGYRARLETVRKLLRLFRDQRLAHISAYVKESKATPAAVYAYGFKPDAQMPLTTEGKVSTAVRPKYAKPIPAVIAFADIVRNLEQGQTVREISEATGVSPSHLAKLIAYMRSLGIVYICEYQRQNDGYPPAVFKLGSGRNATYPKAMTPQEKSARSWEARKAKRQMLEIGHALAGPILEAA